MRIETPRGAVVQGRGGRATLTWNPGFSQKWDKKYSRAQTFVDNEVLRRSTPFAPYRSSFLIKSGVLGTVVGAGMVEWIAPYAKYQYYGKVMTGSAPKILTQRDLNHSKTKNPLAGPFWFERMKAIHGKEIMAGARRIAGGTK